MEASSLLLCFPCMITSSLIDVGISKMVGCNDNQELTFPFRCTEKQGYRIFPTAFHGLASFLSSSSIAAIVPMILGIPFGSMMGLGLLLGIWSLVGGVGYFFLSKPKPPTVYSSQKTVKDGEFT
jgi:hypothetical protein